MTAGLTPPPPRPVPAEVRRRVAAAVMSGIVTDPVRPRRRGTTAWAMAAAAVVLVLVVSIVDVVGWWSQVAAPTDPAPPAGWSLPRPENLGLSREDTNRIIEECVAGVGSWDGGTVTRDDVAIYDLYGDKYGSMAYLMGPKVAMTCQVLPGSTTYQDMGFTRAPKGMPGWMYGPVTIDVLNSGPTGSPEHPGPWAENVAGRVVSRATSVRFSVFGESVTLPVTNGTYLGRIVFMKPSDQAANYTATAYDDAGNVVGTTTIGKGVACAVTPDGVVINGQQGTADCPAAIAWQ
jgi:hypothetical protein